jgi:hypothetical protein
VVDGDAIRLAVEATSDLLVEERRDGLLVEKRRRGCSMRGDTTARSLPWPTR